MKRTIVTGASSGIGQAIYLDLKNRGWDVLGLSRRGPDAFIDITQYPYQNEQFANFIEDGIDMIVHCAGIMPLPEAGYERQIMDVNFWGIFELNRCTKKHLNQDATIVYIGSICAERPDKDMPVYAASKAAVAIMCKTNALLDAPMGIKHICIQPGFYETNLVEGALPQELLTGIPMGYEEHPSKIAHVPYFCYVTPYMTGTTINIDGGASL
jgi:NAD(P)-dependent dehydrogenase (short-subunit alcohol dehydrogenase family)